MEIESQKIKTTENKCREIKAVRNCTWWKLSCWKSKLQRIEMQKYKVQEI